MSDNHENDIKLSYFELELHSTPPVIVNMPGSNMGINPLSESTPHELSEIRDVHNSSVPAESTVSDDNIRDEESADSEESMPDRDVSDNLVPAESDVINDAASPENHQVSTPAEDDKPLNTSNGLVHISIMADPAYDPPIHGENHDTVMEATPHSPPDSDVHLPIMADPTYNQPIHGIHRDTTIVMETTSHSPPETAHSPLEMHHLPLETPHSPLETPHSPLDSDVHLSIMADPTYNQPIHGEHHDTTIVMETTLHSLPETPHSPLDPPKEHDNVHISIMADPAYGLQAQVAKSSNPTGLNIVPETELVVSVAMN